MAMPHPHYARFDEVEILNVKNTNKIAFWFDAEEISDAKEATKRMGYRLSPSGMYQAVMPMEYLPNGEPDLDGAMEEDHCVCVTCMFVKDSPHNYGEEFWAVDVPRTYCVECGVEHEVKALEQFKEADCPCCEEHFATNEEFCWTCADASEEESGVCKDCCDCLNLLEEDIESWHDSTGDNLFESWLGISEESLSLWLWTDEIAKQAGIPILLIRYPHLKEDWIANFHHWQKMDKKWSSEEGPLRIDPTNEYRKAHYHAVMNLSERLSKYSHLGWDGETPLGEVNLMDIPQEYTIEARRLLAMKEEENK